MPDSDQQDSFVDPFQGEIDLDLIAEQIRTFDVQPALKPLVKHGVFLWWSDQLAEWIHPEDLATAEKLVPGLKVFRREVSEAELDRKVGYFRFCCGAESFRALPIVWLEVQPEGFEIGDRVEVKSSNGKRRPGVATIRDVVWERHRKVIIYLLERNGMPLPRPFLADEIRPAVRLGHFLTERERERKGLRQSI